MFFERKDSSGKLEIVKNIHCQSFIFLLCAYHWLFFVSRFDALFTGRDWRAGPERK